MCECVGVGERVVVFAAVVVRLECINACACGRDGARRGMRVCGSKSARGPEQHMAVHAGGRCGNPLVK